MVVRRLATILCSVSGHTTWEGFDERRDRFQRERTPATHNV
jgi:hypothetical protein